MTSRERLLAVLNGELPDCVPVMPDTSNMIPARLTGKPFWDLYLYNDPPIWEAYIDCAKHFDVDSLMDGYFPFRYPSPGGTESEDPPWERFIVRRTDDRIITRRSRIENGERLWAPNVDVYYRSDPPTYGLPVEKVGLPDEPTEYEPLEGLKPVECGPEALKRVKDLMGNQGLIGVFVLNSCVLNNPEAIYDYHDNPQKYEHLAEERIRQGERRFEYLMSLEEKPDFLCVGGSGSLIFQTVEIFRKIALPGAKRVIELATEAGIPTHVHSCGPEKELVRIFAEETDLTVIDPLEQPPMGDCNLAELKELYGDKIVLKGNLHTTRTMLEGLVDDVVEASRKAINDAAEGGGFILSTGDQCGRDTPDENLRAMVETARTYGKY
ncbi:MAG: uroporphyrinogen decarboxylase family protein [Candidatus Brocadiia bacterium]